MAYEQDAKPEAHPEHQESVFLFGMVWVKELKGVFVEEDGFGFLERYPMLFLILPVLVLVPGKANLALVFILYI